MSEISPKYIDATNLKALAMLAFVGGLAYVVVGGSGRIRVDDEIHDVRRWDVVRLAPEVVRSFEAGPDGLELLAIGGPKPEGGDGMISDSPWPDEA